MLLPARTSSVLWYGTTVSRTRPWVACRSVCSSPAKPTFSVRSRRHQTRVIRILELFHFQPFQSSALLPPYVSLSASQSGCPGAQSCRLRWPHPPCSYTKAAPAIISSFHALNKPVFIELMRRYLVCAFASELHSCRVYTSEDYPRVQRAYTRLHFWVRAMLSC